MLAAVWLLWTAGRGQGRVREAVALALFSLLGGMLVAEARELITLVLAIELATMPAYVLIGYRRDDLRGLEGALKYFLLSMLTTLVMLYGFSFLYGLTGTTRFSGIDLNGRRHCWACSRVLFALVGLLAKLSAAPFHYWAPDAYAGATPWTVAFVSTVPKIAGAVAIVRLVSAVAPGGRRSRARCSLVASAASMVLGNLAALTQTDVRRMMAYSGVAHTGYLLLGVAALSAAGLGGGGLLRRRLRDPVAGRSCSSPPRRARGSPTSAGLVAAPAGAPRGRSSSCCSRSSASRRSSGSSASSYLFTAALQRGFTAVVVLAVVMSVVSAGLLPAHRARDVLRRGARRSRGCRPQRLGRDGDRRVRCRGRRAGPRRRARFWPRSAPCCARPA